MSADQLANGLSILRRRAMGGDAGAQAVLDYVESLRRDVLRLSAERDAARADARTIKTLLGERDSVCSDGE